VRQRCNTAQEQVEMEQVEMERTHAAGRQQRAQVDGQVHRCDGDAFEIALRSRSGAATPGKCRLPAT
jgi:hypothetical protein